MYKVPAEDARTDPETEKLFGQLLGNEQAFGIVFYTAEEASEEFRTDEGVPFFLSVILKRITVLKLPIGFSAGALLCFALYPKVVGAAVVMLIDLLGEFEGSRVALYDIEQMYPFGFYTQEAFIRRAEAIKADQCLPEAERVIKYSYVY